MRKIIFVRHAKSSWDNPNLRDHDRPLSERGLRDAPRMAKRLKDKNILPDLILSSTAKRAKQTAEITAKNLGLSQSIIQFESNLYHASPKEILNQIKTISDQSIGTLIVVGHNPGFNDLIEYLGGSIENLPTAGQFGFKLAIREWSEISPEKAEVWFFDYPKKEN
ncbi:SixA phosphatase family protein [Algoriphagus marinus]|uniref:SixA phosphatase family protein n=1 Tax=Algoriphagus marinus TaxID=1925762 RepID=UPI00094BAB5A|nr:histidine phosphatase family protein [Algoriphagus marinus]